MSKAFEKVILHFDGDSFFASVEQVMNYRLRGKPLVTGGERGAITSASLEAKKLGISRGISMRDAKKICPNLIILPGDYRSYSIFAYRMYAIVREFTDLVEEYSIDECFADITGLKKLYNKSYEEIALMIKKKIETSLGVTFGVGMGPSKVLAKAASKHRKPGGFTVITKENREEILMNLNLSKVWGIGPSTSNKFEQLGVITALNLAEKSIGWIEANKIAKPYREIWQELKGYSVMPLVLAGNGPKSIIKSKTFSPPSTNREFIYSQLSKNIEAACIKVRRHKVRPKIFRFYLKTQEFQYFGLDISMPLPSSSPVAMMRFMNANFDKVYRPNILYRATGVSLQSFTKDFFTPDLFGDAEKIEKQSEVFKAVDKIAKRYGENALYLASSMKAVRKNDEFIQKSLDLPFLGTAH